jgi:hypothetical protein
MQKVVPLAGNFVFHYNAESWNYYAETIIPYSCGVEYELHHTQSAGKSF